MSTASTLVQGTAATSPTVATTLRTISRPVVSRLVAMTAFRRQR
ncbi:hypothetical protein [Oryzobacter terrae]